MPVATREHVERACQVIEGSAAFCTDLRFQEVMAEELVDRGQESLWFMLPVFSCEALTGEPDRLEAAYHVAAAWELGSLASGTLDAWQDEDTENALWREIGARQAVNLAVGLIGLSFRILSSLAETERLPPPLVLALKRGFEDTLLRMVAGQHLDLGDDLDLEDYEAVALAKSGSLFRLGCWSGAMVAGASPGIAKQYGAFGERLE